MAVRAEEAGFDDDVAHTVDIVVKSPGVARLTRLSAPVEVEAALALLRGLAERRGDASRVGGGNVENGASHEAAEAPSAG